MFQYRLEKPVDFRQVRRMRDQHLAFCVNTGMAEECAWDLVAIADEIYSNILEHSDASWLEWSMEYNAETKKVNLIFRDNGRAFDAAHEKDGARPFPGYDERSHRGIGLALVKELADQLTYRRTVDQVNELTVVHSFSNN
jgi:anti-sigma regulatory factor (Ser/Thr protein kinase)